MAVEAQSINFNSSRNLSVGKNFLEVQNLKYEALILSWQHIKLAFH